MKFHISRIFFAYWIASFVVVKSSYGIDLEGFTAIKAIGDCRIKKNTVYEDITVGAFYNFGAMVKTGRNSYLDFQLSEANVFRLLARTALVITEDVRNPKLKILELDKGSVTVQLDNFPPDHKFQVETPSAICGAVGTRFVVSFEDDTIVSPVSATPGSRVHRFSCEQGELQVASRFTVDDQIVIAQSFSVDSVAAGSDMVAVIQEGLDNVYTDITVNRGRLTFKYGGDDSTSFVVDADEGENPSRFQAAVSKEDDGSVFVAFKMVQGFADFIFFGGQGNVATRVGSADGAVLVPKTSGVSNIITGNVASKNAQQQLNASEAEGQEFAKLVDMKKAEASNTDIKNQENKVTNAAEKTNKVKKSIKIELAGEEEGPPPVPAKPSKKANPPDEFDPGSVPKEGIDSPKIDVDPAHLD